MANREVSIIFFSIITNKEKIPKQTNKKNTFRCLQSPTDMIRAEDRVLLSE